MSQTFSQHNFFHWNHRIEDVGDPITKAEDGPKELRKEFDGVPVVKVVGLVAASGRDFQGEDIEQSGIDWSYFRKSGWINYEHQGGMENVVGYPDPEGIEEAVDAEGNPATRVSMWLLLDKRGLEIYNKMKMLQKAGGARQFGFSVEGQVLERDPLNPKKILKCRIKNVAITAHPVRDTARVEMVKSLASDLQGVDLSATVAPPEVAVDVGTPKLGIVSLQNKVATMLPDSPGGASAQRRVSYTDLCGYVRKAFPHIGEDQVQKVARTLLQRAQRKAQSRA